MKNPAEIIKVNVETNGEDMGDLMISLANFIMANPKQRCLLKLSLSIEGRKEK